MVDGSTKEEDILRDLSVVGSATKEQDISLVDGTSKEWDFSVIGSATKEQDFPAIDSTTKDIDIDFMMFTKRLYLVAWCFVKPLETDGETGAGLVIFCWMAVTGTTLHQFLQHLSN